MTKRSYWRTKKKINLQNVYKKQKDLYKISTSKATGTDQNLAKFQDRVSAIVNKFLFLPLLSKVIEKLILDQVQDYLKKFILLCVD